MFDHRVLCKTMPGDHLGWWIGFKVTTLGQHLIRNIHAMFGFIPFSGSLKEDICMYFPLGPILNLVPLVVILDDGLAKK